MQSAPSWTPLWPFALLVALSGCGFGTAAVVASQGGGGSSNAPSTIGGFRVDRPKVSPATLHFVLADPDGDSAEVAFYYEPPPSGFHLPVPHLMQHVAGLSGNPARLAPGTYDLRWDYASESDLHSDRVYAPAIDVYALVVGGSQPKTLGVNELVLGLGNDPPVVLSVVPPDSGESSGNVQIEVTTRDSSSDPVHLGVEFNVVGDAPDQGWVPAHPAGIDNVVTSHVGVITRFVWQSATDLGGKDVQVELRITPDDGTTDDTGRDVGRGTPVMSPPFHVDNDQPPIAFLNNDAFLATSDRRRGVVVSFDLIDPESDPIDVVFQWRRPDEPFPPLPGTADEIRTLLADPTLARAAQICTETKGVFRGTVAPPIAPADRTVAVQLPELASAEAAVLERKLGGRTLELFRAYTLPAPVTWTIDLRNPLACVPIGDGVRALLLDGTDEGWRIRKIDLATGSIVSQPAAGAGRPTAMALDRGGRFLFVASGSGTRWRVDRIDVESGTVAATLDGVSSDGEGIRGLAAQNPTQALGAFDDGVSLLDLGSSPARARRLTAGMVRPSGIALDPLERNSVYVAETGANRILALDMRTHLRHAIAASGLAFGGAPFPAPRSIALEQGGSRLLAVCEGASGLGSLRSLQLRSTLDLDQDQTADPRVTVLEDAIGDVLSAVSTGPDGLRILAEPSANRLAVGGGIEQHRTIVDERTPASPPGAPPPYDPSTRTVQIRPEAPFSPLPVPGQPWRISAGHGPYASAPSGMLDRFTWDSSDVPSGGPVHLRLLPLDADLGTGSDGLNAKTIFTTWDGPVEVLADSSHGADHPVSVAIADLDGDGDLDLVAPDTSPDDGCNPNSVGIFRQTASGQYSFFAPPLGGPNSTGNPWVAQPADLDQDGRLDLVVAAHGSTSSSNDGDRLVLFFQQPDGSFAEGAQTLGDPVITAGPASIVVADLNGDGKPDIVSANLNANDLTVFFQTGSGHFRSTPVVLGDLASTGGAISVDVADLDGDGLLDLVSANSVSQSLTIFYQRAPGTFDPVPFPVGRYPLTIAPVSVVAADLDGDGRVDLACADSTGNDIKIFFQSPDGTFDEPHAVTLGSQSSTASPDHLVAVDLDGDGDTDLVVANRVGNAVAAFMNLGSRLFDPHAIELGGDFSGTSHSSPHGVACADLSGTGRLGLVTTHSPDSCSDNSGDLILCPPHGAGDFLSSPSQAILGPDPILSVGPTGFCAGDLDGDGDLDLAAAYWGNDSQQQGHAYIEIYFQTSPEVFQPNPAGPLQLCGQQPCGGQPNDLQAADLYGEGRLDLVAADRVQGKITIFRQDPPGTFAESQVLDQAETFALAVADVDGDGDLDLVSANALSSSSDVTVFRHDALGQYETSPSIALGGPTDTPKPAALVARDLDGDGRVDIAVGCAGNHTIVVYLQQSDGTFLKLPPLGGPSGSTLPEAITIAPGDVDGDGLTDLVATNYLGNTISIFRQTSPGVFPVIASQVLGKPDSCSGDGATCGPQSVFLADVDEDGDLDVVVANGSLGSGLDRGDVTVFRQIAPGLFDPKPTVLANLPGNEFPSRVIVADIDGDGDPDVVCSNQTHAGQPQTLRLFYNVH